MATITIEITRKDRDIYTVNENVIAKETVTDKLEDQDYSNKKKYATDKEYAVQPVEKVKESTTTLLKQEIDEEDFFLPAVIAAINGLELPDFCSDCMAHITDAPKGGIQ